MNSLINNRPDAVTEDEHCHNDETDLCMLHFSTSVVLEGVYWSQGNNTKKSLNLNISMNEVYDAWWYAIMMLLNLITHQVLDKMHKPGILLRNIQEAQKWYLNLKLFTFCRPSDWETIREAME